VASPWRPAAPHFPDTLYFSTRCRPVAGSLPALSTRVVIIPVGACQRFDRAAKIQTKFKRICSPRSGANHQLTPSSPLCFLASHGVLSFLEPPSRIFFSLLPPPKRKGTWYWPRGPRYRDSQQSVFISSTHLNPFPSTLFPLPFLPARFASRGRPDPHKAQVFLGGSDLFWGKIIIPWVLFAWGPFYPVVEAVFPFFMQLARLANAYPEPSTLITDV